jgi:hypothetical protein
MSSDKMIEEIMKPLIKQVKDVAFVKGANVSDEEVLGVIVSKYLKWNGNAIIETAMEALRDSNFHKLADDLENSAVTYFKVE